MCVLNGQKVISQHISDERQGRTLLKARPSPLYDGNKQTVLGCSMSVYL